MGILFAQNKGRCILYSGDNPFPIKINYFSGDEVNYSYTQDWLVSSVNYKKGSINITADLDWDNYGRLTALTNNNRTTRYEYNRNSFTVIHPSGGILYSESYNNEGNVLSKTDAYGLTTSFEYQMGQVISSTDPVGRVTTYEYGQDGKINRIANTNLQQLFDIDTGSLRAQYSLNYLESGLGLSMLVQQGRNASGVLTQSNTQFQINGSNLSEIRNEYDSRTPGRLRSSIFEGPRGRAVDLLR